MWNIEKLGNVCQVFADGDWIESKDQSPKGIRLIQTGNVGEGIFKDRAEKARYISEKTFERLRCTEIFEGDCLISRLPDPVGRACILPDTGEKMITAVDCTIIRFDKKKVIPEFFNYYSQSDQYLNDVDHETTGTTRKRISRSKLAEIEIPIPPLPEQQRIVSVLDKAFASIAQAKSNAERNLINAWELFDSYVGNIFAKPSEEWEEKKLGDKSIIEIIDNDRGVNYPKKSDFHPEGHCLFMNTKNVRPDGFDFTTTMFITEKKDKALGKGKLSRNDVVMTTRGTIGNLGVYNDEVPFEQIRTNSGMLIFRPNLKYIVPEYLFEILRSGIIKSQITKHVSGAAQPQLPIKTLVNFTFPLPISLAEQRVIVGRLEALSAETERLEEIYQQKVESLEELKKSVLAKAFEGEI